MESLSALDIQLLNLSSLSKANARLLESITDVAASIQLRSSRIRLDVVPWETAQDQITATIEEACKAARSYQTPPFVPQVLSRRVKDPVLLCRSIDYLVYANEYLSSKPSNEYGDRLEETMSDKLKQIAIVANEVIHSSFVQATSRLGSLSGMPSKDFRTPRKPSLAFNSTSRTSGLPLIFHSKAPLKDIDSLVQKVYESFDSVEMVHVGVRELLTEKMGAVVSELFDAPYLEEAEGSTRDPSASHANLSALAKHYQPGDHKLMTNSASCRAMIKEVAEVVQTFILEPTREDYAVATMAGELCEKVFHQVMERAAAAIRFRIPADVTVMFIESGGTGIGLFPAGRSTINRHFRDCIFIGLDSIAELWHWVQVADDLPGDAGDVQDTVRETLAGFLDTVRESLMTYRDAKGKIRAKALVTAATEHSSKDWMPSVDCTVHESTTNMLHMLRVLFSSYFGATKLALHGPGDNAEDDADALQELEDFVQACVEGTIDDLEAIALASMSLSNLRENSHRAKAVAAASKTLGSTGKERCRVDVDIFIINNASFLLEHLKSEPCFYSKTRREAVPVDPKCPPKDVDDSDSNHSSEDTKNKQKYEEVPIMRGVVQFLEDIRDEHVEKYCESWGGPAIFPPLEEDDALRELEAERSDESLLSKEQRMAVKLWYREVADRLSRRLSHGSVHVVMDAGIRSALIDGASNHVLEKFEEMEDVLRGREWSTQPLKWSKREASEWVDELQKLF